MKDNVTYIYIYKIKNKIKTHDSYIANSQGSQYL